MRTNWRRFTSPLQKAFYIFLLFCCLIAGKTQAQTLKIEDFAVWGGSTVSTSYNSSQGVTIGLGATIQGNIGSNHLVTVKNNFVLTGNIYSGNAVTLGNNGKITGNIFAAKNATNSPATTISADNRTNFIGNLTAKGKIVIQNGIGSLASTISGKVAVPAPTSTNYSGPAPAGGITNTVPAPPTLPSVPLPANFDNLIGTTNITNTQTISPGVYKKLAFTGSKTLTFNGPGNYIFYEVDNGITTNKLVFDFKNTTTGTINIFIIKDAKWGKLSVGTINGNFPSRIYTEIHGNGSANSGFAFDLQSPGALSSGTYSWLGNVWASNGGITVKGFILSSSAQIIGALWSATKVDLSDNLMLSNKFPDQTPPPPTLKLSDFAVWGGSDSSGLYKSSQGVTIGLGAVIQGNIGSNHLIDVKNRFSLTGNLYSGNTVSLGGNGKITGDIFAARKATNAPVNAVSGGYSTNYIGNLTAKGKIVLQTGIGVLASTITGQVAVPAPTSTNYSGPTPAGGIINTVILPVLPAMPSNTSFDNQAGTTDITNTQTISPGKFRKLALTGNKTLTFNGPGNYIFNDVDNSVLIANKFVFDFKNTSTGAINIFVIKDAKWGKISVNTVNGNFPSRIYTEVHGTGSTNNGFAFDLQSPGALSSGTYSWLGNVWAPNGGITVKGFILSSSAQILGALWSGTKVDLSDNIVLSYQAPAVGTGPNFVVNPYYPPPANGKVTAPNNVIGAELFSLSQKRDTITSSNEIFILGSGKVMIEVISKKPNDATLKLKLKNMGMSDTINNGPHSYVITGNFPIDSLPKLNGTTFIVNGDTLIKYVRPLYPAISNAGLVTTQGDITMRSNYVRDRFGLNDGSGLKIDGSGVKIGVISDSYGSKGLQEVQADIDEGELPGNTEPVQVVVDAKGNDEGRAMLQIVHDIAPKAKLAFRTGFLTAGDFAKGILELANPSTPNLQGQRCDIIVDDITYITEPFLRNGIVAKTVDSVVKTGVTYFSSAGNFGSKSYEAVFNGVSNTSVIPSGRIHNFAGDNDSTKIYQTIKLNPGSYTIVLQWSDDFYSLGTTGVQTDMDLYLVDINGFPLFGFNRSNLFGDPFEVCPFTVTDTTNAKLMVVRAAGTSNVRFKYIIFRGDATITNYQNTNPSTIVGHPNADSAIAVGAMLYADILPYTSGGWPGVASFSSRGGAFTLKNNTTNTYTQRNKPELIGPNGANTTVNLGGTNIDGDPFPNFFGTSAAAPHVAAVGALIIQARKLFNLQSTVTPYEVRQQLVSSAGKFSPTVGFSFDGGYGYVQADSAIQQIANAKPIIDSLIAVTPGTQNGTQPFQVKIKGKYLTSTTKIFVRDSAFSTAITTIVSPDKTEATAIVPAIINGEDPPFWLNNLPKSPSQKDGGNSDSLYLFSSKTKILIRPADTTRKFGQNNPTAFTVRIDSIYNGDTIRIINPQTLANLKVNNLQFITNAAATSPAGRSFAISLNPNTPLPNNDPALSTYRFTFVPGVLTVKKMPLKITPQNKQIKYGEFPDNIVYNYELEQSPANSSTLLDSVMAWYKKYLAGNGLIVVNGFSSQNPPISQADLDSMSTMASFQAVRNARKFLLQSNGQLQPLVSNINPSQIDSQRFFVDVAAQSLRNYKLNPVPLVQPTSIPHARGFLDIKTLVGGTAKTLVNGQLQAMVNGQLLAMVNGQSLPIANGQLQALVNGQLQALVNGQLLAIVNGQLMALVNGQLEIVQNLTLSNGQLQALVNGQLQAIVNGQLQAMVNGVVTDVPTTDIHLINGQLQAIVNGQLLAIVNGQLQAIVNGQLQAIVNNFDVSGTNNNVKTLVLVDEDDINQQAGNIAGMFSMNMITDLNPGTQTLIPGAFVNENFEVTYGLGQVLIKAPLTVKPNDTTKVYGDSNPAFTISYSGFINGDDESAINTLPVASTTATDNSVVGNYTITLTGGSSTNYFFASYDTGKLTITKKPLNVTANDTTKITGRSNPAFRISYNGFVGNDTTVCIPYAIPPSPAEIMDLNQKTTYTNIKLNNGPNYINASPGQSITITGGYSSIYSPLYNPDSSEYCPGCITQIQVGMSDGNGGNVFNQCFQTNNGSGVPATDSIRITFNAPTAPGVYYITNESTWWFFCGQFADPVHINSVNKAIAVVVVNVSNTNITATTTADSSSAPGDYPITLQGCNNYNPNYDVILHDGTLTVTVMGTARIGNTGESQTQTTTGSRIGADILYPNPASSKVRLQLSNDVQTIRNIQIYDGLGKLHVTSSNRINDNLWEISVSGLSRGIYIIVAKTTKGIKTFKFMKN